MKNALLAISIAIAIVSCARSGAPSSGGTVPSGAMGSGTSKNTGGKDSTVRITATFYPLYIMCLNITDGADGVDVSCLAPPSAGCLHDYSLTTRDAAKLEECNILIANGAGMESFLDRALETKGDALIIASEGYALLDDNPHIWVSVEGARHEVKTIAAGLARLDSGRAALYMSNAKRYESALDALSGEMHKTLDAFKGRDIVTFHEAFPYFACEFGLNVLSVIEREAGTVPSAKEIADTVRTIKAAMQGGGAPALFAEPQYSSSSAKLIEAETGLKVYMLDPCVTGEMTKDAYIKAQQNNAKALPAAFEN